MKLDKGLETIYGLSNIFFNIGLKQQTEMEPLFGSFYLIIKKHLTM